MVGSRPSQLVKLFHKGALVEEVKAAMGERVDLTAAICEVLGPEERERLMRKLDNAGGMALRMLESVSDAARDDKEVVLAAVQQDGRDLRFAGPTCKDDREIVIAAMEQDATNLEFAGEACKNNRNTVLGSDFPKRAKYVTPKREYLHCSFCGKVKERECFSRTQIHVSARHKCKTCQFAI